MAYSAGGLIQAVDYNGLATTNSANIAWVWGTGQGDAGYGQNTSLISSVSASNTVTAVQWAGLLYTVNGALAHQSGTQVAAGNLNAVAGGTITAFSNVSTAVTTINTNRLNAVGGGTTLTGSNFDAAVSSTTGLSSYTVDRTVTFASVNAARYFFNAGGQLTLRLAAIDSTNNGSENSFSRLVTGLGGVGLRARTNTGRSGTGITLNTNNTAHGYYNNVFNSATTLVQVTDTTSSYTASTGFIQVYTSSSDTTNGGKGLNVVFRTVYTIADKTWDDTLSLTYRMIVDIVNPSTLYLANTWGTPTIT
jgi:hypothetical protein